MGRPIRARPLLVGFATGLRWTRDGCALPAPRSEAAGADVRRLPGSGLGFAVRPASWPVKDPRARLLGSAGPGVCQPRCWACGVRGWRVRGQGAATHGCHRAGTPRCLGDFMSVPRGPHVCPPWGRSRGNTGRPACPAEMRSGCPVAGTSRRLVLGPASRNSGARHRRHDSVW